MGVKPGKYDRRVTIQKRTVIKKPGGDDEVVWYGDDAKTVWAAINPLTAREYLMAGALSAPEIIKVKMWFRPINTRDYRLTYRDKVYHIESMTDKDCAHIEMELTCTEEVGAPGLIPRPEGIAP